jgi:Holliday junction resolvase RusA-like endonuclease
MKPVTFTVLGDPVPQPRARVSTVGGFARAYVPAKHPVHAYRLSVAQAAIASGLSKTDATLEVIIDAVFQRPKSHSTKRGVKPTAPKLPRPDCDNIAKAVLDAMADLFDDSQVRRLVVEKSYGEESRTTVRVQA